MKLFPLDQPTNDEPVGSTAAIDRLTAQMSTLIVSICERLSNHLELCHLSLYIFHCQVKIDTYHKFDRFLYAVAAVLVATKLTENLKYPIDILRTMRKLLREKRGLQGEEAEEKTRSLLKRVFEAEVTLMINLGFDFDIELGLVWLHEWQREIRDAHLLKKAEQALTSLYRTSLVIHFRPLDLALTAVSIVLQNEGMTLETTGWDSHFIERMRIDPQRQRQIMKQFVARRSYRYD